MIQIIEKDIKYRLKKFMWHFKGATLGNWNIIGEQILKQGDIVKVIDFDPLYVKFLCIQNGLEYVSTKKAFTKYMEVIPDTMNCDRCNKELADHYYDNLIVHDKEYPGGVIRSKHNKLCPECCDLLWEIVDKFYKTVDLRDLNFEFKLISIAHKSEFDGESLGLIEDLAKVASALKRQGYTTDEALALIEAGIRVGV